ncbi:MAG TPA: hypothetical protein QF753_13405 [Victivallales bacterium]|nr:hypothetical protein [Victivallales bacterium]
MGYTRRNLLLGLGLLVFSSLPLVGAEKAITVNKIVTHKNSYDGTVREYAKPGPQSDIRFGLDGFNGLVTWIIPAGSFVRGPIYNSRGEIIRQGDVLIRADTRFYEHDVKVKEAEMEAVKADVSYTKVNCERYKKLAMLNSVSKKAYDLALADYLKAKAHLISTESELEYSKLLLSECTIYAPYSGYVQEVFTRVGSWCNVDYPGLRLMRLSPLFVDVKMSRNLAKAIINDDFSVTVFTDDSKNKTGVNNSKMSLIENGIRIPVKNYLKSEIQKPNAKNVIYDYSYISKFTPSDTKLSVPVDCLYKNSDGKYYVWQALDQKSMQPEKNLDPVFKIKKISVVPADKFRNTPMSGWMQQLEVSGSLERNDIIIKNPPEGLKDGDTVTYRRYDTLFWPGDKVKVLLKSNR